jgi:hypothetical protein
MENLFDSTMLAPSLILIGVALGILFGHLS